MAVQRSTPTPILPAEYQQCEYIESTGNNQFILTNIAIGAESCAILLKYFKQTQASKEEPLVMAQYGSSTKIEIGFTATTNRFFAFSSSSAQVIDPIVYGNVNDVDVRFNTTSPYATITMTGGGQTVSGNKTTANASGIANGKFTIFTNATGTIYCTARLYYLIFSRGDGTSVFRGIPCYRKSDGEAGLYDLVGETFYPSNGSGHFNKGADVN